MALTEVNSPAEYTPVYNDMWHVLDSDKKSQPNFKYRFKIYVNGTYIGRPFTVSPDPDYGYGRLNVSRIVSAYVTYTNDLSTTDTVRTESNSWAKYYVVGGEEYGALSSGVTVYDNLYTSSTVYAYAGAINTLDFDNFAYSTRILNSSSKLFSSNIPRTFRIYDGQHFWLGGQYYDDNDFNRVQVKTYNKNGTLIDTYELNNTYNTPSSNDRNRFLSINAGFNLNDIGAPSFALGTPPIITDSVYSYTIKTLDNGIPGTAKSETVTFKIQREHCDYDEGYDIFFQNAWGFFDSYRFTRYNSKSITATKKEYKQNKGAIESSGWVNNNKKQSRTTYYSEFSDKWILRSDWLNTDESEWLAELIASPTVFIRLDVGGVNTEVPVIVTNTEWEKKSTAQGEVFKLDLNIEFSVKNYRQRA